MNLIAYAREQVAWLWLFVTPPRTVGVVKRLAGFGPIRAAGLSLVLVALLCAPFAVASGWIYSHVFFLGPSAPAFAPWWQGSMNTFVWLLVPYPVWLAILAGLHWAVAGRNACGSRLVLSCRFVLTYLFLYVEPAQHGDMLFMVLVFLDFPQIPGSLGSPLFYVTYYGGLAMSVAVGLLLLGAGLAGHRRVLLESRSSSLQSGSPRAL